MQEPLPPARLSSRDGDKHVYAPRSRFITDADVAAFELIGMPGPDATGAHAAQPLPSFTVDLKEALRRMWS